MSKLDKKTFVEALKNMTLLEIKELVDGIKEEFGIDISSAALAGNGGNNSQNDQAQAEKTKFTVVMKSFGEANSSKIPVIKKIHEIMGLGLKEAKNLADTPNSVLKEDIDKAEAESIKEQLEKLGAIVELK
ncbi:50S ribosomal protein L7/L12 [Candidatus Phytoplasma luffae]|uniref:Large ribosomal subunit protein bL12 n=1 Tax=Loofah witches'-broom phytoplasma TaxID=35773 RepID=A0A975FJ48_LOWBP|nr:50S ribosomal protein L7/L12 [Candidatus Phytoplasma luffae]QTX02849.1 50S ribosomal protein L7/L12 [Candidatus Phytoplasma luffae]